MVFPRTVFGGFDIVLSRYLGRRSAKFNSTSYSGVDEVLRGSRKGQSQWKEEEDVKMAHADPRIESDARLQQ